MTNPPGLSTVAYRVDEFAGFRHALLEPLPGEQALAGWHPAPGDLGLQVLEWWAYLGDVLTFYNERFANESYLRTAELPDSVTELVALLGFVPRPAIAAVGKVAAIRGTSRPHEPVVVPAGLQLSSTATPGVPAQTFEAAAATFEGRSNGPIVPPPSTALLSAADADGNRSVLLEGRVSGFASGDRLVLLPRDVTSAQTSWTAAVVVAIAKAPDPNGGANTSVLLSTGEGWWWSESAAASASRVVQLGRSAQPWTPQGSGDPVLSLDGSALRIRLSSVVHGIPLGEVAYLDYGGTDGLVPVVPTAVNDEFLGVPYPGGGGELSPPDIPVLHSVVTAQTPYAGWLAAASAGPVLFRFGLRDVGTPIGAPATTLAALPVTVANPSGLELPAGATTAFVEDATGAGIVVTASAAAGGAIALAAGDETPDSFSLAVPLQLDLDLVDVSRGTTVANEQLGAGDASVPGQSFTLKKAPLTYLQDGAGWESTLRVAVDAIYWTEVPTFYDQPADARVYVVSQQPDGKSRVRFGDGVNGARLPTGSAVVATYRYGAGAASPPAGRLTTILKPQPNLSSVRNPVAVWGGADAQDPDDVRTNAPASVLTFGRAISADDYETVAALAPGVSRARAYWTWDEEQQRTLVKVYVGDDAGAVASARAALAGADDPNRPVVVAQGTPIDLTVACTLEVSPDHVPDAVGDAATAALAELFAPASIGIGRPLYTSELEEALSVEGVEAVHGLSATAGGVDPFSSEPVGWADPGEGGFYVLAASAVTPVAADA
ncbi:MAG TPA: baseplate J/gp47 family protein [Gaiellaceae bacterium]|nr:baseplate J/gp47 family protein [Gaiellaceae bacterium]